MEVSLKLIESKLKNPDPKMLLLRHLTISEQKPGLQVSFWYKSATKCFRYTEVAKHACGLWQLCLHNLGPCGFSAFFYVTLVTHVTPRDVRVPGLPQLITSRHRLGMSHLVHLVRLPIETGSHESVM